MYSKRSNIFHTPQCPHILRVKDILGSVSYNTCVKTGRVPCKHCLPKPIQPPASKPTQKPKAKQTPPQNTLSHEEQRALARFHHAKQERDLALKKGDLSEIERKKVLTLTQPGMAFWAGRGYGTFHQRNCRKIAGLTELVGFSRYQEALNAGYKPCRLCKPTSKQDVAYSIPITSREREDEQVQDLAELCDQQQLPWQFDGTIFFLQTQAGKWRINTAARPVKLEHINLIHNYGNSEEYHVQPRLFLSLIDTFAYIIRHDRQLLEQTTECTLPLNHSFTK